MPINVEEAVTTYLGAFVRRRDGAIGAVNFGTREGKLMEIIQALATHVSIYDAAGNISEIMCQACAHHRKDTCPIVHISLLLKELHRDPAECPKGS